jgi:hypothetical protein
MGWFEIAGVHDYRTALIEQSTLVFDTRNLLDFVPVFVEAREVSARSRRRVVDIVKGRMRDQDGDQRRAIQHGESHAAYRLPRRTGAVRNSPAPFSLVRAYGAMLAKRVAIELTPARSPRKKVSR